MNIKELEEALRFQKNVNSFDEAQTEINKYAVLIKAAIENVEKLSKEWGPSFKLSLGEKTVEFNGHDWKVNGEEDDRDRYWNSSNCEF